MAYVIQGAGVWIRGPARARGSLCAAGCRAVWRGVAHAALARPCVHSWRHDLPAHLLLLPSLWLLRLALDKGAPAEPINGRVMWLCEACTESVLLPSAVSTVLEAEMICRLKALSALLCAGEQNGSLHIQPRSLGAHSVLAPADEAVEPGLCRHHCAYSHLLHTANFLWLPVPPTGPQLLPVFYTLFR